MSVAAITDPSDSFVSDAKRIFRTGGKYNFNFGFVPPNADYPFVNGGLNYLVVKDLEIMQLGFDSETTLPFDDTEEGLIRSLLVNLGFVAGISTLPMSSHLTPSAATTPSGRSWTDPNFDLDESLYDVDVLFVKYREVIPGADEDTLGSVGIAELFGREVFIAEFADKEGNPMSNGEADTFAHEILHIYGLSHPYGDGYNPDFDHSDTIMSYNWDGRTPGTVTDLDIAAIRALWGSPSRPSNVNAATWVRQIGPFTDETIASYSDEIIHYSSDSTSLNGSADAIDAFLLDDNLTGVRSPRISGFSHNDGDYIGFDPTVFGLSLDDSFGFKRTNRKPSVKRLADSNKNNDAMIVFYEPKGYLFLLDETSASPSLELIARFSADSTFTSDSLLFVE